MRPRMNNPHSRLLKELDLASVNHGVFDGEWFGGGPSLDSISPIDGKRLARVRQATASDYDRVAEKAHAAFLKWREVPAPKRGEIIRQFGESLRRAKADLGRLVTLETGKILAEGEGEVQEMIDICDFAVGLSRQLYGLTIASERPRHRMLEQWHPLGVAGIISAFNFPVAVWAWNAALAIVCGDPLIWKPSFKTPLCAVAVTHIAERVCRELGVNPAIFTLLVGETGAIGERLTADRRVPLISATGSCAMGVTVGQAVQSRMGRTLLELGGNNAVIVAPSADLALATRAIVFGAVGTAGQRCTSTRRVIAHESVLQELQRRLIAAYQTIRIGNPLDRSTVMGPLIDAGAVAKMQEAIEHLKGEGGNIICGGDVLGGCYVRPCIATAENHYRIVQEET